MGRRTASDSRVPPVWQTAGARLTAFLSPAAQITPQTWWEKLLGEPPEKRTTRPKIGGQQEEGPFESGTLKLAVAPARIDWVFAEKQEEQGVIPPPLGEFPEALDPFIRLTLRWLEICPPLQRLAFGAVLFQPTDNRESGYRLLSKYLRSVKLDPKGSSDFSYQINRPRDTNLAIEGLRINRLSKWSVLLLKIARFSMGPESVGYSTGQDFFACHLELDINTVADYPDELPKGELLRIFQELVNLAKEISIKGDIP